MSLRPQGSSYRASGGRGAVGGEDGVLSRWNDHGSDRKCFSRLDGAVFSCFLRRVSHIPGYFCCCGIPSHKEASSHSGYLHMCVYGGGCGDHNVGRLTAKCFLEIAVKESSPISLQTNIYAYFLLCSRSIFLTRFFISLSYIST